MSGAPVPEDDTPDPAGGTPARRPGLILACYLIAAVSITLDQVTKAWVLADLVGEEPVRLLGGALYLNVVRNPGAAFSMATDYTWVLAIIATCVVVFLIVLARRIVYPAWSLALGLVLGGAAGNLIDRVFQDPSNLADRFSGGFFDQPGFGQGHVIDFLSVFDPHGQVFPIFNLADSSLVCGVILIVALELTGRGFSPASRRGGPETEK